MWEDPIVLEIRKIRDEQSARFNYDLEAIYRDVKNREQSSGREVVSFPPRKPQQEEERDTKMEISSSPPVFGEKIIRRAS